MSIVKFYRNDPNAPKTTMPAHLGANAIITCGDKLLLERRRDSDTWGLVGGGVKKYEEPIDAMARESWDCAFPRTASESWRCMANREELLLIRTEAFGAWSLWCFR